MKRAIAFLVLFAYTFTQVLFAHQAEASVWEDRTSARMRRATAGKPSANPQLAQLSFNPLVPLSPRLPVMMTRGHGDKGMGGRTFGILLTHATIQEIYQAPQKDGPVITILQDIHLNPEAQNNMGTVLQALIDQKRVGAIAIEGAFAPLDFKRLRAFPDKDIMKKVAKAYVDHKKLAAPSYVGITSAAEPPIIVGVDDKEHYDANVQAYLSSREIKPRIEKELAEQRRALAERKAKVFSMELKRFDGAREAYQAGQLSFGQYVEKLTVIASEAKQSVTTSIRNRQLKSDQQIASVAERRSFAMTIDQFLAAYTMERTLNFPRVDHERKRVISKLADTLNERELSLLAAQSLAFQQGQTGFGDYYQGLKALCEQKGIALKNYQAFDDYIRYVALTDGINAAELMDAVEELEKETIERLAKTDEARALMAESERLALTQKLINFELTPKEWEKYRHSVPEGYSPDNNLIIERDGMSLAGIADPETKDFSFDDPGLRIAGMTAFKRFYEEADIRSQKIVSNLLTSRESLIINRDLILVVGGFHTPLITRLLKERGVSYVVVSPKVTRLGGQANADYLSIFAREKTPIEKLFAGEKLFITPPDVNSAATLNAVYNEANAWAALKGRESVETPIVGFSKKPHAPQDELLPSGLYAWAPKPSIWRFVLAASIVIAVVAAPPFAFVVVAGAFMTPQGEAMLKATLDRLVSSTRQLTLTARDLFDRIMKIADLRTSFTLTFGYEDNIGAQLTLIQMDFERMIREKEARGDRRFVVYGIGLGVQTDETMDTLRSLFVALMKTSSFPETWHIEFVGIDINEDILSRAQTPLGDFKAQMDAARIGFSYRLEHGNMLDMARLADIRGKGPAADYIFHRNIIYPTVHIAKGGFSITKGLKGKNVDKTVFIYLSSRSVILALAGQGTRYVVEPPSEFGFGLSAIFGSTPFGPNYVLPGTEIITVRALGQPVLSLTDVDNTGTGLLLVKDPRAMEEPDVETFLRGIEATRPRPSGGAMIPGLYDFLMLSSPDEQTVRELRIPLSETLPLMMVQNIFLSFVMSGVWSWWDYALWSFVVQGAYVALHWLWKGSTKPYWPDPVIMALVHALFPLTQLLVDDPYVQIVWNVTIMVAATLFHGFVINRSGIKRFNSRLRHRFAQAYFKNRYGKNITGLGVWMMIWLLDDPELGKKISEDRLLDAARFSARHWKRIIAMINQYETAPTHLLASLHPLAGRSWESIGANVSVASKIVDLIGHSDPNVQDAAMRILTMCWRELGPSGAYAHDVVDRLLRFMEQDQNPITIKAAKHTLSIFIQHIKGVITESDVDKILAFSKWDDYENYEEGWLSPLFATVQYAPDAIRGRHVIELLHLYERLQAAEGDSELLGDITVCLEEIAHTSMLLQSISEEDVAIISGSRWTHAEEWAQTIVFARRGEPLPTDSNLAGLCKQWLFAVYRGQPSDEILNEIMALIPIENPTLVRGWFNHLGRILSPPDGDLMPGSLDFIVAEADRYAARLNQVLSGHGMLFAREDLVHFVKSTPVSPSQPIHVIANLFLLTLLVPLLETIVFQDQLLRQVSTAFEWLNMPPDHALIAAALFIAWIFSAAHFIVDWIERRDRGRIAYNVLARFGLSLLFTLPYLNGSSNAFADAFQIHSMYNMVSIVVAVFFPRAAKYFPLASLVSQSGGHTEASLKHPLDNHDDYLVKEGLFDGKFDLYTIFDGISGANDPRGDTAAAKKSISEYFETQERLGNPTFHLVRAMSLADFRIVARNVRRDSEGGVAVTLVLVRHLKDGSRRIIAAQAGDTAVYLKVKNRMMEPLMVLNIGRETEFRGESYRLPWHVRKGSLFNRHALIDWDKETPPWMLEARADDIEIGNYDGSSRMQKGKGHIHRRYTTRHYVDNYLGSGRHYPVIFTKRIPAGTPFRLVFLTDGVSDTLTFDQIDTLVSQEKPADEIAQALVGESLNLQKISATAPGKLYELYSILPQDQFASPLFPRPAQLEELRTGNFTTVDFKRLLNWAFFYPGAERKSEAQAIYEALSNDRIKTDDTTALVADYPPGTVALLWAPLFWLLSKFISREWAFTVTTAVAAVTEGLIVYGIGSHYQWDIAVMAWTAAGIFAAHLIGGVYDRDMKIQSPLFDLVRGRAPPLKTWLFWLASSLIASTSVLSPFIFEQFDSTLVVIAPHLILNFGVASIHFFRNDPAAKIIKGLSDKREAIRSQALEDFKYFDLSQRARTEMTGSHVDELIALIAHKDRGVRRVALEALIHLGYRFKDPLNFKHLTAVIRRAAIVLGRLEDKSEVEELREGVERFFVKVGVESAFEEKTKPRHVDDLLKLIRGGNEFAQEFSWMLLRHIAQRPALREFIQPHHALEIIQWITRYQNERSGSQQALKSLLDDFGGFEPELPGHAFEGPTERDPGLTTEHLGGVVDALLVAYQKIDDVKNSPLARNLEEYIVRFAMRLNPRDQVPIKQAFSLVLFCWGDPLYLQATMGLANEVLDGIGRRVKRRVIEDRKGRIRFVRPHATWGLTVWLTRLFMRGAPEEEVEQVAAEKVAPVLESIVMGALHVAVAYFLPPDSWQNILLQIGAGLLLNVLFVALHWGEMVEVWQGRAPPTRLGILFLAGLGFHGPFYVVAAFSSLPVLPLIFTMIAAFAWAVVAHYFYNTFVRTGRTASFSIKAGHSSKQNNEDRVVVLEDLPTRQIKVYAVLDGIGGHQGGVVAVEAAAEYVEEHAWRSYRDSSFLKVPEQEIEERLWTDLGHFVKGADGAVAQALIDRGLPQGVGNRGGGAAGTIFLIYTKPNGDRVVYAAQIGDTKLMWLPDTGGVELLTIDNIIQAEKIDWDDQATAENWNYSRRTDQLLMQIRTDAQLRQSTMHGRFFGRHVIAAALGQGNCNPVLFKKTIRAAERGRLHAATDGEVDVLFEEEIVNIIGGARSALEANRAVAKAVAEKEALQFDVTRRLVPIAKAFIDIAHLQGINWKNHVPAELWKDEYERFCARFNKVSIGQKELLSGWELRHWVHKAVDLFNRHVNEQSLPDHKAARAAANLLLPIVNQPGFIRLKSDDRAAITIPIPGTSWPLATWGHRAMENRRKKIEALKARVEVKKEEFKTLAKQDMSMVLDQKAALARLDALVITADYLFKPQYDRYFDIYMRDLMNPLLQRDVREINFILGSGLGYGLNQIRVGFEKYYLFKDRKSIARRVRRAVRDRTDWHQAKNYFYLQGLPLIFEAPKHFPQEYIAKLHEAAGFIVAAFQISPDKPVHPALAHGESLYPQTSDHDIVLGRTHPDDGIQLTLEGRTALSLAITIIHEGGHAHWFKTDDYAKSRYDYSSEPQVELPEWCDGPVYSERIISELTAYAAEVNFVQALFNNTGFSSSRDRSLLNVLMNDYEVAHKAFGLLEGLRQAGHLSDEAVTVIQDLKARWTLLGFERMAFMLGTEPLSLIPDSDYYTGTLAKYESFWMVGLNFLAVIIYFTHHGYGLNPIEIFVAGAVASSVFWAVHAIVDAVRAKSRNYRALALNVLRAHMAGFLLAVLARLFIRPDEFMLPGLLLVLAGYTLGHFLEHRRINEAHLFENTKQRLIQSYLYHGVTPEQLRSAILMLQSNSVPPSGLYQKIVYRDVNNAALNKGFDREKVWLANESNMFPTLAKRLQLLRAAEQELARQVGPPLTVRLATPRAYIQEPFIGSVFIHVGDNEFQVNVHNDQPVLYVRGPNSQTVAFKLGHRLQVAPGLPWVRVDRKGNYYVVTVSNNNGTFADTVVRLNRPWQWVDGEHTMADILGVVSPIQLMSPQERGRLLRRFNRRNLNLNGGVAVENTLHYGGKHFSLDAIDVAGVQSLIWKTRVPFAVEHVENAVLHRLPFGAAVDIPMDGNVPNDFEFRYQGPFQIEVNNQWVHVDMVRGKLYITNHRGGRQPYDRFLIFIPGTESPALDYDADEQIIRVTAPLKESGIKITLRFEEAFYPTWVASARIGRWPGVHRGRILPKNFVEESRPSLSWKMILETELLLVAIIGVVVGLAQLRFMPADAIFEPLLQAQLFDLSFIRFGLASSFSFAGIAVAFVFWFLQIVRKTIPAETALPRAYGLAALHIFSMAAVVAAAPFMQALPRNHAFLMALVISYTLGHFVGRLYWNYLFPRWKLGIGVSVTPVVALIVIGLMMIMSEPSGSPGGFYAASMPFWFLAMPEPQKKINPRPLKDILMRIVQSTPLDLQVREAGRPATMQAPQFAVHYLNNLPAEALAEASPVLDLLAEAPAGFMPVFVIDNEHVSEALVEAMAARRLNVGRVIILKRSDSGTLSMLEGAVYDKTVGEDRMHEKTFANARFHVFVSKGARLPRGFVDITGNSWRYHFYLMIFNQLTPLALEIEAHRLDDLDDIARQALEAA